MSGLLLPYKGVMPRIASDAFIADGSKIIGDVSIESRANVWFNCVIRGDEHGYSHALLGIFDPIAPAAAAALAALADGDEAAYERLFAPTVPLSRLIFRAPTQYYKTGVVFLAWLNGFQDHFVMALCAFRQQFPVTDNNRFILVGLEPPQERQQPRIKDMLKPVHPPFTPGKILQ